MLIRTLDRLFVLLTGIGIGILVALLAYWSIMDLANAATFNTFFNNVEQGANSTASPSVVVGGKKKKTAEPVETTEPEEAMATTPQPTISNSTSIAEIDEDTAPLMRLGLLAHQFSLDTSKTGGSLSLSLFPRRALGLGVFSGIGTTDKPFFGAELELNPLDLNLFDLKHFIEIGGVLGVSTLGRDSETAGTVHAGIHAGINFGDRYGLMANWRTNLTNRELLRYSMIDAGIAIRF